MGFLFFVDMLITLFGFAISIHTDVKRSVSINHPNIFLRTTLAHSSFIIIHTFSCAIFSESYLMSLLCKRFVVSHQLNDCT